MAVDRNLTDTIQSEQHSVGRFLDKIPGFRGYRERSRRRKADQLLRDTIAGRLQTSRLRLSNVQRDLSRNMAMAIDYAEELGRADNNLMGFTAKIKDAPQGYAGFFDAVKIDVDDLERIYAFDESLLQHVDEIDASIQSLGNALQGEGDFGATLRRLNAVLQKANEDFARRSEVLAGLQ